MADVNIDVENIEGSKNAADDLQFQDIPHDAFVNDKGKVQTHTFTDFPPTAEDDEEDVYDKTKLIKDDAKTGSPSFWTFEYYQQFFDVETKQVLHRIAGSMVPSPRSNYLQNTIRPNPDLYGPFWICTTLVFTTAIAGNMASYLSNEGKDFTWKYDFHKVTFAATAIFSYWWVLPAMLFGFLWWRGSKANYSFLEILCIYGYSLSIYIPISILWVVQFDWLQWTLVLVGAVLSGGVLVMSMWPAVKEETKKTAWIVLILIFLCHASLAVGFKLYFFNAPVHQVSTQTSVAPMATSSTHMKLPTTPRPSNDKPNLKKEIPTTKRRHVGSASVPVKTQTSSKNSLKRKSRLITPT